MVYAQRIQTSITNNRVLTKAPMVLLLLLELEFSGLRFENTMNNKDNNNNNNNSVILLQKCDG